MYFKDHIYMQTASQNKAILFEATRHPLPSLGAKIDINTTLRYSVLLNYHDRVYLLVVLWLAISIIGFLLL